MKNAIFNKVLIPKLELGTKVKLLNFADMIWCVDI